MIHRLIDPMHYRRPARLLFVMLLAAIALCAAGCKGKTEPPKPVIRLSVNPWTGSAINAYVAKIILQEKMGYPVELVSKDGRAQWISLAEGEVDASLEIWPSGRAELIKKYVDNEKLVENLGILGVVGKVSWYVPAYVIEQHPELSTWEGFKNPGLALLFKTSKSGSKGQFLAGDPSWVQYDRDIIRNLKLDLEVVQVGSEEAVLSAVYEAFRQREPILFYLWTPHSIHAKYQLTEVKLPKYSDAFYAKAGEGGVACDYSPEVLFKVAWPGLKKKAPEAYQFLKNFTYTNRDQIEMLAMVELEGMIPEEAARKWIAKNEARWSLWLPVK